MGSTGTGELIQVRSPQHRPWAFALKLLKQRQAVGDHQQWFRCGNFGHAGRDFLQIRFVLSGAIAIGATQMNHRLKLGEFL